MTLLSLTLLAACDGGSPLAPAGVDRGAIAVCLDGGRPSGEDTDIQLQGTITEIDAHAGDCTRAFTVEDADGVQSTIGLLVLDADNLDITPDLNVEVGAEVSLIYRYRMVWGDVAGFSVSDSTGLVAAAEEGAWGGALEADDLGGLSVSVGELIGSEETSCEPVEGHSLVFSGDEDMELDPIDSDTVVVAGRTLTAHAIAAYEWGAGNGCDISDNTGRTAFVVHP